MAAGLATLKILRDDPPYDRLEALSARLEDGLDRAATDAGVPHVVQRVGSMLTLFFHAGPVWDYDDAKRSRHRPLRPLLLGDARPGRLSPVQPVRGRLRLRGPHRGRHRPHRSRRPARPSRPPRRVDRPDRAGFRPKTLIATVGRGDPAARWPWPTSPRSRGKGSAAGVLIQVAIVVGRRRPVRPVPGPAARADQRRRGSAAGWSRPKGGSGSSRSPRTSGRRSRADSTSTGSRPRSTSRFPR